MPLRCVGLHAAPVTSGPLQHFFGYYDKHPWNLSGRLLLTHEIPFGDRMPGPDDAAGLAVVDLHDSNRLRVFSRTRAWCWQQGSMLQWWNAEPENRVLFNDRRDGSFVCVVADVRSGDERVLPRAVGAVSRDGSMGLCLNFSRLAALRPGYGYEGLPDPYAGDPAPRDDGIFLQHMHTGDTLLAVSLADVARFRPEPSMDGAFHWLNHVQFSADGGRFMFLHRWNRPGGGWFTRLFTADPDGSRLYLLNSHEMTSHCDWRDGSHVLSWANRSGVGARYFLFADRSDEIEIVGDELLTPLGDGHCSYSPDRSWILTDTYPRGGNVRRLLLYSPSRDLRIDLGDFFSPPEITGPQRCDLHPCWNRDGTQVCIDSAHDGTRQVYVLDLQGALE
ncbi:MAG: hypothetical protein JW909_07580 [Planctomycetes bacterium]|nr:hypothetical protein [Planctomycetota bacterium]